MNIAASPYVLPALPDVERRLMDAVVDDYRNRAESPAPQDPTEYTSARYGLDLRTTYAGYELRNPFGKASGQLSMTAQQVEEDVQAGLGFVVLKTIIAQDDKGRQSMSEWAVKESRMLAEPIIGSSGEQGWTISWKGRGWWHSFDEYLQLVREARRIAEHSGTLIVPSCKYHLPKANEDYWKTEEYAHTTRQLLTAWTESASAPTGPMPLEKDFSPTLAGSDLAAAQATIVDWLCKVPEQVLQVSGVRLGLKLFNALFDDEFQLEMLRTIHSSPRQADYFVYGNRLFDPSREFDGHRGIAYGGPDLSDRNLGVMSRFQQESLRGGTAPLPWSATGNISTGKIALEYALRGASSFQLHTFFQLPSTMYSMKTGSKTQKALHELYFHPQTGLIVWLHHLASRLDVCRDPIRLQDVVGRALDPRLCPTS